MTANPQAQQIQIRLLLPLYGDNGYIDAILKRADGQPFNLLPMRYRPQSATAMADSSASQWYCRYTGSITVRVEIQLNHQLERWEPLEIPYSATNPLELGLGQLGAEPLFFLIQGILPIPIPPQVRTADSHLQSLWITAEPVQSLLFHPSGLHLMGTLPTPFYAPDQPSEQQTVVLRVPQTPGEDEVQADDPLAQAFPDLNLSQQRFWSLTALELPNFTNLQNCSAIEYIKAWAKHFEQFSLPKNRRLQTFIDNVECQPRENCIIQFFKTNGNNSSHKINWIGKFINTRIAIGGGDVAEASFQPQFLIGELQQQSNQWICLQVQFETTRNITTEPDIQLALTRLSTLQSNNGVLQIPGSGTSEITVTATTRSAGFINEFGLFRVDDAEGRVDGLLPNSPGYAQAALAASRRLLVLQADQTEMSQAIAAGNFVASYLIQNDTADNFLSRNAANDPTKVPLAFFSLTAANPDGQSHVHWNNTDTSVELAWEDGLYGGDQDFDDLIVSLKCSEAAQGIVEFKLAETPVQAISIPSSPLPKATEQAIFNYRSWLCTRTGWLAIDSTARQAEIDPDQVTQGAVFGAIELDKLFDRLQPISSDTGIAVQVQTLEQSRVTIRWNPQPDQLSLEIYKPLLTFISPPVWFQEVSNPAAAQPTGFNVPTLTSPLDETDPEQILRARLLPAVFVSASVIKPQKQLELPISAVVQFEQQTFQFQLNHGVLLNTPQPIFDLDLALQSELDQPEQLSGIRQQFTQQEQPLSSQVTVVVKQTDWAWLLIDQVNRKRYWVRKESVQTNEIVETKLNVYQPLLTTDENLEEELDAGDTTLLRQLFASQRMALSRRLKITQTSEQHWTVLDEDLHQAYLIEQIAEQFSVYPVPSQQLLAWNQFADNAAIQTRNYPLVQSLAITAGNNQRGFLDSNRGLIPCQPQADSKWVEIEFANGLPSCSVTGWQLISQLILSRYFLPTLPGIELNLSARPIKWLYRHSVPALDEAYAEVSETPTDPLSNTGNVQGRDFTRIRGTEAFTLLPADSSRTAQGWLHKTSENLEGAVEIQFGVEDALLLAGLAGQFPQLELTIGGQQTVKLSRTDNTGGVTFPLKVETRSTDSLPEFTVAVGTGAATYEISNNGQPLIAAFSENLQRVVTLDGNGQVQEEPIEAILTKRKPQQKEQRYYTGSFALLPELQLDLIGVRLGDFSPSEAATDLYSQRWMLHDGKGGWAKLKGFALYPLRLKHLEENSGQFSLTLEAVWLHTMPKPSSTTKPSQSGETITLTCTGNEATWNLKIEGTIDWRFPISEDIDQQPELARLQAKFSSQPLIDATLQFEQTDLTVAHPIGLIQLTSATGLIREAGQFTVTAQSNSTRFHYNVPETIIQADQNPLPLQNYQFNWSDVGGVQQDSTVPKIEGGIFKITRAAKINIEVIRNQGFVNEFGLFRVDDVEGNIDGIKPGSSGYITAVLQRRIAVIRQNQNIAQLMLPTDSYIASYLVQNNTIESLLNQNPNNDPAKFPCAFFSIVAANPDRQEHIKWKTTESSVQMAWEDLLRGGDRDFDDLIATLVFSSEPVVLPWELTFTASEWHLRISYGDTADLISLPLVPYRISSHKFIFAAAVAANLRSTQIEPLFSPDSWFDRAEVDRGLVAAEFDLAQPTQPNLKALIADLQLRLTDKVAESTTTVSNANKTRLIIRFKLDLLQIQSDTVVAEISGVIALKNALQFQDSFGNCIHTAKFYFDRAQIPIETLLKVLDGEGSASTLSIAGLAAHTFQFGDGKTFAWQSPQTIRLTTVERFAKTFLPRTLPPTLVLFDRDQTAISASQLQNLQPVLQLLQENEQFTATIEGHAAADDSENIREITSRDRARQVCQWLIDNHVNPHRLGVRWWSNGNPRSDTDPAQNRRVEVLIEVPPNAPIHRGTKLAIEAGAVFELQPTPIATSAQPRNRLPDLANNFIQLFVRQQTLQAEDQRSYVVRLPLVTLKEPGILARLPVIQLQQTNPDQIYRIFETRTSSQPLAPRLAPLPLAQPLEILHRTLQAQWLDSTYLSRLITPELGQSADLQPAFLDEQNQITLKWPSSLGDLEWMHHKSTGANLTAATLITSYALDQSVPEIDQPVRLAYPFTVSESIPELSSQRSPQPSTEVVNLQLISFVNGALQQLAQENLSTDNPNQWGRERLQEKRRYEAAIVIEAFEQVTGLIPRPFEALRETLSDFSNWMLDLPDLSEHPYGEDFDPRCQLPTIEQSDNPAQPKTTHLLLQPDTSLGLLVFDAAPQRPPVETRLKSAAATRFRLAPTGTNASYAGKLRPAQIPSIDEIGLLALKRWDDVPFVESTLEPDRQSSAPAYPAVNPRTIGRHPLFENSLLGAIQTINEATPLLPPLVDVVAWACRPGEMTRSLWSLNRLSVKSEEQQEFQQVVTTHATSVSLRRPRAVAAPDESVRLKVEKSYLVFDKKFFYANLLLTQVMGKTAKPEAKKVYGVLTNRLRFFESAVSLDQATNPALLSYSKAGEQKQLESIVLYLVADKHFMPSQYNAASPPQQIAKTVLFWTKDGKAPDTLDSITSDQTVLIADLPNPTAPDTKWILLQPLQETYLLNVADIPLEIEGNLQKWIEKQIQQADSTFYLVLSQYTTDDPSATPIVWKKSSEPDFVLPLSFLDQGNTILAPKQTVALLAVQPPLSGESKQVTLSGYARLSNDDFSPIQYTASADQKVEWVRQTRLQTLDRVNQVVKNGEANYEYDLVFYGSGGELIPTEISSD